jgi:hypothetical protein
MTARARSTQIAGPAPARSPVERPTATPAARPQAAPPALRLGGRRSSAAWGPTWARCASTATADSRRPTLKEDLI